MGSIVSLVRTNSSQGILANSIKEALDLAGFQFPRSVKTVVIKPNLCYYWSSSTGSTTDPQVVAAIIDDVREKCGADVEIKIAEADASAMRTEYAFPVLGYERLAKEKDIELFNLSQDVLLEKTVNVKGQDISFQVPQILLTSDLFINVPKLKIMRATKITCAMKNVFGCIGFPRKVVYHPLLDESIVGINKVLRPHVTVVDGIVALGRFPIRLGLIMASMDTFSVDWVVSKITGNKPSSVKFLKIAMEEKLGTPVGLVTKGENVEDFAKVFPKAGIMDSDKLWSVQFWLLDMYRKISGDIIPPAIEK
jgi:uncharacterized protein (DUF362 family)